MKKTTLITLALALAAGTAQARELFVSVNSSSPMTQGAALVLAGQALQQQVAVRVLLCDGAGDLALAQPPENAVTPLKPRDVTPQQMLQGLLQSGATVQVCALYLPNSGKQAEELLPGVAPAQPADVMQHVLGADVQTLSF